jgi:hypothetical protein
MKLFKPEDDGNEPAPVMLSRGTGAHAGHPGMGVRPFNE